MRTKRILTSGVITAFLLVLMTGLAVAQAPDATPLGTGFTYQGQLKSDGTPYSGNCDFLFGLYDTAMMGTSVGELTVTDVPVSEGIFTTQLDFGSDKFMGDNRWLEIWVRCPAGSGTYQQLLPRQPLTAAPYAQYSQAAPWSGITNMPGGFADGVDNDTTYTAGSGLTLSGGSFSVNTAIIQARVSSSCTTGNAIRVIAADGTVTCEPVGGMGWSLTGNAGTTPVTNFLGTTDNQSLELRVNNQRVFLFQPNTSSPNLIGGNTVNWITNGVYGATISGGGTSGYINRVTDNGGTIGGGSGNQAGDNDNEVNSATYATVGAGYGNNATKFASTVSGGIGNTASGLYSSVPGGMWNTASGSYSLAAGYYASAQNSGSFVWADSQGTSFASSADNTFNVRAQNGALIYANSSNPGASVTNYYGSGTSAGQGTGIVGRSDNFYGYGLAGWNYGTGVGVGAWSYNGNLIEAFAGDYPGGVRMFYVDSAGNVHYHGTTMPYAEIPSPTGGSSSYVSLYGISAAEAWYEDLGSNSLIDGKVTVVIDPLFAKTVSLIDEYQVQVTATCDEAVLLFVSEKTEKTFTVQGVSLDGKPSNCGFDYRISAKPLGMEELRLEATEIPEPITVERDQP